MIQERQIFINFNYKTCPMQIHNHFLTSSQPPLRIIDQNVSVKTHNSPNCFQPFSSGQPHRLKRRLTQIQSSKQPDNSLFKSIRISYKENVAFQALPKNFSAIKQNHHASGKLVQSVQFKTIPNRINFIQNKQARTVSINPFELKVSAQPQPYKPLQKNIDVQLKQSDFYKLKQLGKGKFGTVWLVRHKDTKFICAMKIIKKSVVREEKVEHQVAKQIRIHNTLKHVNIISFYGYFHDQDHFYILTQYATGGHVYGLIKKKFRLIEEDVCSILKETIDGLQFMHNLGYIHRDLKPQNLILQFDTVKICDLGWAAQCSPGEMRKSICGTPLYYSPQMVRQSQHNGLIDVWSLGVLAYQLLIGRIPFKIWSEFDLPIILEQQVVFPDYIDLEEETKDFILNCLAKASTLRPNISSLKNHPFLKCKKNQISLSLYEEGRSLF